MTGTPLARMMSGSLAMLCRVGLLLAFAAAPARSMTLVETPMLAKAVAAGELPPVRERLPKEPLVLDFETLDWATPGRHGGSLHTLVGRAKDIRMAVVYGYARLVVYNTAFEIVPDILRSFEVEDGRIFTLHLREGHRWSDGHPFTAEDFRYWWEDVANNEMLSPAGPPRVMLVDGETPRFEILDDYTVRYTWSKPNPYFLPRLAGASPLFIYRPAHYLKQFHIKYANPDTLAAALAKSRRHNWASLHNAEDDLYRFDNPALPTLQPWINHTAPPATRFVMVRNPYFHRIDPNGRQLPYIDRLIFSVADPKLIPAKAGTGEADLQARHLAFSNYTFLVENEKEGGFDTYLWRTVTGSHIALFPNLNVNDPVWRKLFRDARFRRALSLGIDRAIINEALFFGLAREGNNTVQPESPLYRDEYRTKWTQYDPERANALLDELGLDERNDEDIRLLPDGRPAGIIIETAGEDPEQVDVLELIRTMWAKLGIKLFIKPSQREVLRNRIFAGETQMSVWSGLENGVPTAGTPPDELAPTSQQQLQWPKWGQYYETSGEAGEAPDMPAAVRLLDLLKRWTKAGTKEERKAIWHEMLAIRADRLFSIGIVSDVKQPIVVANDLMNVPKDGIYNWDPGAHFGIYHPDAFWFDRPD